MKTFNIYGEVTDAMEQEFALFMSENIDEEVTLRFDSVGGSVESGLRMYNTIQRHHANVVAQIDFLAASIAGFLALSCNELRVCESSLLMIHQPWGTFTGNANDLLNVADMLDKISSVLKGIITERTSISEEEVNAWFDKGDTWFTSAEIVDKFQATLVTVSNMIFNKAHFANLQMALKDPIPENVQAMLDKVEEPEVVDEPEPEEKPEEVVLDEVDNTYALSVLARLENSGFIN